MGRRRPDGADDRAPRQLHRGDDRADAATPQRRPRRVGLCPCPLRPRRRPNLLIPALASVAGVEGELRFERRMSDADALLWSIEKDPLLRPPITALPLFDRSP